ncbi:hypothetical protein BaRGS_00035381 [Batillaria attramentaria]|uniref:HTH psq-type domain-containing protein n=1 Tax=Batillaria attramentaria TaxID=370345 RepID=A0ABD0JEF0_9CAEN
MKCRYKHFAASRRRGRPRSSRDLGYKRYRRDDLLLALESVHWGMSLLEASRIHGVPCTTLFQFQKQCRQGHNGKCKGAYSAQESQNASEETL